MNNVDYDYLVGTLDKSHETYQTLCKQLRSIMFYSESTTELDIITVEILAQLNHVYSNILRAKKTLEEEQNTYSLKAEVVPKSKNEKE